MCQEGLVAPILIALHFKQILQNFKPHLIRGP